MPSIQEIDWAAVMIRSAKATAPTCRPKLDIVNGLAAVLPAVFAHYDITTPRRQTHFISQSIVEAWYFQTLEELASGDAYDQRTDLGFTPAKDGDGRTNKGFGIFQTTGPFNQARALAQLLALGFEVDQDVSKAKAVLTQPKYAAWAAGIFWSDHKLNAVADRDSTGKLMGRAINRGNANSGKPANGEAERLKAFKATWMILQNPPLLKKLAPAAPGAALALFSATEVQTSPGTGQVMTPVPMPADGGLVSLRSAPGEPIAQHQAEVAAGDTPQAGPASPNTPLPAEPVAPGIPEGLLKATQQRLADKHWFGIGTPDGEAGWKTVQGIAGFQAVAHLPVTGQLDQATMDAIWAADAPEAPQGATRALAEVADLKGKSVQIDAAQDVKTASWWQIGGGMAVAGGSAIVSGFSDAWTATAEIRAAFADVPAWGWGLVACAVAAAPAAYNWMKANRVQQARLEDHRTGKTA
jgi:predicted chitinase